jgi:hypothetical protein
MVSCGQTCAVVPGTTVYRCEDSQPLPSEAARGDLSFLLRLCCCGLPIMRHRLVIAAHLLIFDKSTTAGATAFLAQPAQTRSYSGPLMTAPAISRDSNSNRCRDRALMPPSRPIVASPKPQLLQTRLYLVGWQNARRLGGYCRRDDKGKERSKVKFNCEALAASRPVRGSSAGLLLAPREQQQVEWLDGDNARDTPPPYDGSALAQAVFSHPYFYDG